MGKILVVIGLAAGCLVATAVPASACSCAELTPRQGLRASDAAVIATLKKVELDPVQDQLGYTEGPFTYRINRVFKGRARFGLRAGRKLVIQSNNQEAACGLPREKRAYGLFLYRSRGELTANLCTLVSKRGLRKAAKARNRKRSRPASARPPAACRSRT